jgi:hypothetical protein
MDIATLQIVIDMLKIQHEQAYERFNLHPSDPYCEGKVIGAYEALTRVEALMREEVEYRDARTA